MKILNTEEERLLDKVCEIFRKSFDRYIGEQDLDDISKRIEKVWLQYPEDYNDDLVKIKEPELPKGWKDV